MFYTQISMNVPAIHVKMGTCADDVNRYDCTCESGYTGADCETSRPTYNN